MSPRTDGPETIEALADALESSLPGGVIDLLVGHSLGAVVALEIACRAPQRVFRLVLEEPPGPESIDGHTMATELEGNATEARARPGSKLDEIREAFPRWHDWDCRQTVYDLIACDDSYAADGLRRAEEWRTVPLASAVTVPTLVLLAPDADGVYDDRVDATALRGSERQQFQACLKQADVRVLNAGHCIHRDDPCAWLAAVATFAVQTSNPAVRRT
jgi:pimeloyl-ACP methyl ester carboxylesterase